MPETKRKTTTSTAVKQRYIDKTYTEFRAKLRNEDFAEIDALIQSKGWSRADFIKKAYDLMAHGYPPTKTIEISIVTYDRPDAECEAYWFLEKEDALWYAEDILSHLTDQERKDRAIIVTSQPINVPIDYEPTTGEQLLKDLCDCEIESPDFDPIICTVSTKRSFFHQIL